MAEKVMRPTKERLEKIRESSSPELFEEIDALQKELEVAKERFGPAGYKIISEVAELRRELEAAKSSRDTWASAARAEASLADDARTEAHEWRERHAKLKEAALPMKNVTNLSYLQQHLVILQKALAEDEEYDV